jgi:hypothetical protein
MAMRASRAGFVRLDGTRSGVTVACAVAGLLGAAGMTAWSERSRRGRPSDRGMLRSPQIS